MLLEGDVATGEDDDVEWLNFQMKSKAGLLKNLLKWFGCKKCFKARCGGFSKKNWPRRETILDVMRILKEEFDS
jgi:hypothetical protein